MTKQLTMMVGVAMLAALALAGALGIFAFSTVSAQTTSDDVTRSFSTTQVAPGGTVDVTITLNTGLLADVVETLPVGWNYESASIAEEEVDRDGQTIEFAVFRFGDEDFVTYTVTAPDTAGSGRFSGTYSSDETDVSGVVIGGPTTVNVGTGTTGGNGEPTGGNGEAEEGITLSSKTAGAAVQVVIKASADTAKTSANDITVNLAKFGVPASIPERSIIIGDDSAAGHTANTARYIGEPGSVTVSGTKVTLSLYARFPGSSNDTAGTLEGGYTITFKQSAGITNPPVAGTATVTVSDGDTKGHSLKETIQSVVSLSKGSGARGTDVTVKGVGLGAGGATVYLVNGACADQTADCEEEDDISLGTGNVSGGKVEVDIETSSSDFEEGVYQINKDGGPATAPYASTDSLRGRNHITIVDGTGKPVDKSAYFTVTPTIAVDEDAVQQGDELTIIVEDWYYGTVTSVTIGDESATIEDRGNVSGDFEIDIIVPPSARLGEQELKVTGTRTDRQGSLTANKADVAKGSVIVGALAIELEPSSFVLGQQFTINVKGFSTEDPGNVPNTDRTLDDIQLVKVGNHELEETTSGVGVDNLSIDTNGFFTNTFRLNSKDQYLKPGSYRVQVEDHSGRVALGRIIIPEPTITVSPEISRRGTTVSIVGENFPAGRVVQIYYRDTEDENQQGAVLADSAGRISISFTVPSDAEIGEEQDVTATSAAQENDYKAKAMHSLPPQEIIVTPMQVVPGGRLTIEGHNMPLYTLVGLRIADIGVGGRGAETDGLGSFLKEEVLVPQLKPGTHTVEASVQTQGSEPAKVRTTIEIVTSVSTGTPADLFASQIEAGVLDRIFLYENDTQEWFLYDPDPGFESANSLEELESGDIIWIQLKDAATVQGENLLPGWSLITIR